MAQQFDNELRGVLFKNAKVEQNAKAPYYKGSITIGGREYNLAAWVKESEKGNKFLSLKAEPKDDLPD